jgi:dihydrofolate reductase
MRKLVLQMQSSLDGCVAGPKGELDWIFADFGPDTIAWEVPKLWEAGAHLMGSHTYREMAAYWPKSDEPYAPPMNEIPKIVFSRSLERADWKHTTILSGDLGDEITRLKREPGKDLLAHGGVRFARSLLAAGLVDELRLIMHPVVLGKGQRISDDIPEPLRCTDVHTIAFKSGAIVVESRPNRPVTLAAPARR